MVGKLLGKRYEILDQLGGGGMALVYKARCTLLNREVTIKVLRPEYTSDVEFVDRFRREAQAVASLSHTNIVSVYDVGEEDGIHYIVMEYIDGRNLKEIIREHGALPIPEAVEIARQICEALDHAHENNIVHRDIKPHNILITKDGRVKVTDFGIARAASVATVTNTGTILGSVHYISPEQAKGEPAGTKSDIYAVGVVLYEMVTGQVPFAGDTPIATAIKHIQAEPVPPSRLNPRVPAQLEQVILRSMAKDPYRRYSTARTMASELKNVLQGQLSEHPRYLAPDEFATQVLSADALAEALDQAQQGKKKKKKLRPAAKIALVILGVLMVIGSGFALGAVLDGQEVKIPDVTGVSQVEATKQLELLGLKANVIEQLNEQVEEGKVIKTYPEANKFVRKGRVIDLYISQGAQKAKMPDVRGKKLAAARADIENAGFSGDSISVEELFNEAPQGTVYEQDPEPEKEYPLNQTVTLYVSKGPEPENIEIPNLIGLTLNEAKAALAKVKLELSEEITEKDSAEYFKGQIIDQDPKAGQAELPEGSEVKVVVSKGPGPAKKQYQLPDITVPDDGRDHDVSISVKDAQGENVVYQNTHAPGDVIQKKLVTYYGKATISVKIDDEVLVTYQVQ